MHMEIIRCILIDDEEDARFTLRNCLENFCEGIEIIAEADGVSTGIEAIKAGEPDLVFLDIRMYPGTGFDVLEAVSDLQFDIIFVTAYDKYAIRAIRFSALDYLLKPLDIDDLQKAISKLREARKEPREDLRFQIFKENLHAINEEYSRIVLPTMEGFIVQEVKEIIRCEADRNYTHFHLENGKKLIIPRTLKIYDELLSQLGFFRTHQSHLINLNKIIEYKRRKKGGIAILKDKTEVPVSDSRKDDFKERFLGG